MKSIHNYVYDNGFRVCVHCGKSKQEHYFLNDQISISERSNKRYMRDNYKNFSVINSKNTVYFDSLKKRVNQWATCKVKPQVYTRLLSILNYFDGVINIETKQMIIDNIMRKKPQKRTELYSHLINFIYSQDLPIPSTYLFDAIKQFNRNIKLRNYLSNVKNNRKYYWYISKRLSEIPQLPKERIGSYFVTIKKYYDLVRFGLYTACNPIFLIDFLIYSMINQYHKEIPKKYRSLEFFNITGFKFKSEVKKHLKTIKKQRLDKGFEFPLDIHLEARKTAKT